MIDYSVGRLEDVIMIKPMNSWGNMLNKQIVMICYQWPDNGSHGNHKSLVSCVGYQCEEEVPGGMVLSHNWVLLLATCGVALCPDLRLVQVRTFPYGMWEPPLARPCRPRPACADPNPPVLPQARPCRPRPAHRVRVLACGRGLRWVLAGHQGSLSPPAVCR